MEWPIKTANKAELEDGLLRVFVYLVVKTMRRKDWWKPWHLIPRCSLCL